MNLNTLLREAITNGGGTPLYFDRVRLMQQLVTTYGGDANKFTVPALLREAITARGGTPTQQTHVALLRELITTLGATPTSYSEQALTAQLAGISPGGVVTPPAPSFTTQPSISPGSGTAGVTAFTATNGVASNASSYSRRWLLNGTAVSTAGFYTPSVAGSLVLEVTATGAGGSTIASSTAITVVAEAGVPPPVFSVVPTISGTATEGETLTATTGTASGSPSYSLQWKRGGANISGATGTTYVLQSADVGSTITVTSTATNAGGSVSQTSIATAAVAAAGGGLDPAISAPMLSLVTANTTYPPQFDIGLDDTAVVGDVIRLQWKLGSSDFTSPTGDATNAIDAGEATANAASFTGLSSITSGTHRFRSRVERGASYGAWSNIVIQGPDDIAPVLSALSSTFLSSTTGKALFTTNEGNGAVRAVFTTTNVAPSLVTMDASAFSLAISSTGAKEITGTGLTASTVYYAWVQHTDAAGNKSAITAAGSFTTAAVGSSLAKFPNGSTGTTERSPSVTVTGDYTVTGTALTNSNSGVKADLSMPSDCAVEITLPNTGASGEVVFLGVCDASHVYGPAQTYTRPGASGEGSGFTAMIQGASPEVYTWLNGNTGGGNYNFIGATVADGDKFMLERSGSTVTLKFYDTSAATVLWTQSFTLTSQIPTDWKFFVGIGTDGVIATANFGAGAFTIPTSKTGW